MTACHYTLFAVLLSTLPLFGQNTVGTIAYNPDLYTDGYTMIYPHNQNRAMLLNACGEVVHNWTIDEDRRPGNTAYLQPNGDIIMTSRSASVSNAAPARSAQLGDPPQTRRSPSTDARSICAATAARSRMTRLFACSATASHSVRSTSADVP